MKSDYRKVMQAALATGNWTDEGCNGRECRTRSTAPGSGASVASRSVRPRRCSLARTSHIVLCDPDPQTASTVQGYLTQSGYRVTPAPTAVDLDRLVKKAGFIEQTL